MAQLKKLIIIARHGPREPMFDLPNLREWEISKDAQLTEKGKLFCQKIGEDISKLYPNFIPMNIIVESSNIKRTIQSAKFFMKGFYKKKELTIKINRNLAGTTNHTEEQKIEFININNIQTIKQLCKDDELYKNIENIYGYQLRQASDYFDIYSTIDCYIYDDRQIPKLDINQYKILEYHATQYLWDIWTNFKYTKELIKPILDKINNILKSDIEFVYFSTHDSVLYSLLIEITGKMLNIPKFCSIIKYELWDNDTLKIYYDDILINDIDKFMFNI